MQVAAQGKPNAGTTKLMEEMTKQLEVREKRDEEQTNP
jgi:hypothetical protein